MFIVGCYRRIVSLGHPKSYNNSRVVSHRYYPKMKRTSRLYVTLISRTCALFFYGLNHHAITKPLKPGMQQSTAIIVLTTITIDC